ncbi:MAG: pyrroloquinoline quinone biosynthesis protein PqqE [Methylacidiphilales bacterium]|nr:pyrroloquinoline quinone biosynthesis protein PqqE [Candidatus Methylacidiphilales bacterium]
MKERPYALLAELTYRCPLHCPYCSNPAQYPDGQELSTGEWKRVFAEAGALGVLQLGLSGGEPLGRKDLAELIRAARNFGIYTNLITSAIGLTAARARELQDAGLDSVQISFQADEPALANAIAGSKAHDSKLNAVQSIREAGLPLSLNVVLHRANIGRLAEIIRFAESLGAVRLELANVQYYGWGKLNQPQLLPAHRQVQEAIEVGRAAKARLAGKMDIFYVLPDYYEDRPKPCMQGWGRRYLTVNPMGQVLPCPNASSIAGLSFDNVREQSLAAIWNESASFNRFRGTEWMPLPCRECPQREIDYGGCRCQAALLVGDPAATDPVCSLSPNRKIIDRFIEEANAGEKEPVWVYRQNPPG